MWLVNLQDFDELEALIRYKLRCETYDPALLRTATYLKFKKRCMDHISGNICVRRGEAIYLQNIIILVLCSDPCGIIELELYYDEIGSLPLEEPSDMPQPTKRKASSIG